MRSRKGGRESLTTVLTCGKQRLATMGDFLIAEMAKSSDEIVADRTIPYTSLSRSGARQFSLAGLATYLDAGSAALR
jgi:hypothetical protein